LKSPQQAPVCRKLIEKYLCSCSLEVEEATQVGLSPWRSSPIGRRRLSATDYQEFLQFQLEKSRDVLEHRFHTQGELLAWPFGIYDDELMTIARKTGYLAGFTIERRKLRRNAGSTELDSGTWKAPAIRWLSLICGIK
jgi:hypothetical protein